MTVTAAASTETTWPSPDFLDRASRLRNELEAAIRLEQSLTQRVASIQDQSFQKALPAALLVGGPDALKKLYAERDAAILAVNDKRAELRQFLASSRAGFFAIRDKASANLHAGVSERFARAQKLAEELCDLLVGALGAEAECARQEVLIRAWNRLVKKYSRTIPSTNVNAIPAVAAIDRAESIRSVVVGMLLSDPNIRAICREILQRETQQRERAQQLEEARLDEAERLSNPAAATEPF